MLEALDKVDGDQTTAKWKAEIGVLLFGKLDLSDLNKIGEATQVYGLKSSVEGRCRKCGKVQEVELPTGDFFASGLQGKK